MDSSLDYLSSLLFTCDVAGMIEKEIDSLEAENSTLYVYSDEGMIYQSENADALKLPALENTSIAVSVVWKQIFGNKGVVMTLLGVLGIEQKISFLGNPGTALGVIILMGIWQFGSSMLIFLSALKQIPGSLYEWRVFAEKGDRK